jgi:hypothetical protein
MLKFGVKNLRRLEVDQPVDIRPITILVGRNSSGKSTFLRTFPLIRQSIITRTSSPVLWYGDLVDFGDFEGAVYNNDTNLPVMLTFCQEKTLSDDFYYAASGRFISEASQYKDVSLTISVSKKEGGTKISALKLAEGKNEVSFDLVFGDRGRVIAVLVNGVDLIKELGGYQYAILDDSLLPDIAIIPPKNEGKPNLSVPTFITRGRPLPTIDEALLRLVKPHVHQKTGKEKLDSLIKTFRSLSIINKTTLFEAAKKYNNVSTIKFFKKVLDGEEEDFYTKFSRLLLLALFPRICNAVTQSLKDVLAAVLYIGPARARSDRYYRYQDLSVSEIDPDGKNFAMFLNSLTETRISSFSAWVKNLFGYGVKVTKSSGHITISLEYENKTVNIVDTGYGISQILPVLGQIWWANNGAKSVRRRRSGNAPLLAIEQPELHLHPAHQALLADAFVNGFKHNGTNNSEEGTHFIIETHSEALINRLGALVSEKKLSKDDVQILIFETKDLKTEVKVANFDDDGLLSDWPFGFFLPDV